MFMQLTRNRYIMANSITKSPSNTVREIKVGIKRNLRQRTSNDNIKVIQGILKDKLRLKPYG